MPSPAIHMVKGRDGQAITAQCWNEICEYQLLCFNSNLPNLSVVDKYNVDQNSMPHILKYLKVENHVKETSMNQVP